MSMSLYTRVDFPSSDLLDAAYPIHTDTAVITTGNLVAGAVLGRVATAAGTPAYGLTNVGNGTIGSISLGAQVIGGVYSLVCNIAGASAKFTLTDPLGTVLSTTIAIGSQQTTTHLVFTITAGGTAFAVGDVITGPVLASNFKLAATAAVDGSATPVAVLLQDTDATSSAQTASILLAGRINARKLSYGTGHSLGTVKWPLRALGIHVVTFQG